LYTIKLGLNNKSEVNKMIRNIAENHIKTLFLALSLSMIIPSAAIADPSVDPLVCGCIVIGDDYYNIDYFTTNCETRALSLGYPRARVREPRLGELIPSTYFSVGIERCDGYIDGKASCIKTFSSEGVPVPSEPFMCLGVGL
jgi:hypothetical protein